MVHYKLTYFPVRGVAECARQVSFHLYYSTFIKPRVQIFALAGQEFEDVRLSHEQFMPVKPNLPFGQMPVLEIDGEQLAQSKAICRFLARKFG
ncbi:unnamed protein product [Cylicostephanus goldi]|uniref:glutathione transferase n=1 Tax=Cylicostephanus goldi TaxID=71465 RepID=A0A3P7PW20_CYLGO|nr:unnamed protein product [Cylicostephanus goldi]